SAFSAGLKPRPSARQPETLECGEKSGLDQFSRQADLRSRQNLGDRAACLGVGGVLLEGRVVDAGNLGLRIELNAGDAKALADLLQMHGGGGVDAGRGNAAAAKSGGKR